jgi:Zn finger protein HypA/HybF involved in hydrogenase expression
MTADELRKVLEALESCTDWSPTVRRTQLRDAVALVRAELARVACWCETCQPITLSDMRMVLCPDCGNKRCPHATHHENACTGSNEPGQPGSSYAAAAIRGR